MAAEKSESKCMSTEDVISELGRFGRYQLFHYVLIVLPVMMTAMFNANFIFIARESNYRCKVPECEDKTTKHNLTPPWLQNVSDFDFKCHQPSVLNTYSLGGECNLDLHLGNNSEKCTEWVHEEPASFIENLHLECSPVKRSLIGTIHYSGMVISMPLMGFISDKYGRKFGFVISSVGGGSIGLLKAFVNNYLAYTILEFLESAVGAAVLTTAFVLMVELSGKDYRFFLASLCGFSIAIGEITFGLVSSYVLAYKTLILITYTPTILFLSYIFLIDESIRWLLTTGRKERARDIILKAARWNGKELSRELVDKLENLEKLQFNDVESENANKIDYKELVTSKVVMVRLLIAIFWWFSSDLIYYGLLINSVALPGNEHQNFMMAGAIGILGDVVVILCLNRYGRKKTLLYSYMICAIALLGQIFIPADQTWAVITLFLVGKMFIATAYSSVYTYASELFPTQVRSLLVGVSSMFAGVGSIIAPMSPLLAEIMPQLPSLIFGLIALVSGILAIFTPETLNRRLPDTIKEAEEMKRL